MQSYKPTSLSQAIRNGSNSVETIEWKQAQITDNKEHAITEYIARGFNEIEAEINMLKSEKADIDARIKELTENEKNAKKQIATYMIGNGIEKMEGSVISSITIISSDVKEKLEVEILDSLKIVTNPRYTKQVVDEHAVYLDLKAGVAVDGARLVKTTETKFASIRINRKRAKDGAENI